MRKILANKLLTGVALFIVVIAAGVWAFVYYAIESTVSHLDANNPGKVALGEAIYGKYCAGCHGVNLEGQPNWKIMLEDGTLPAPPHDETGHTWHHGDQLLFNYTKKGAKSLGVKDFKSGMPVYEGILGDAEIWAVLSFIKSRWTEDVQKRQTRLTPSQ